MGAIASQHWQRDKALPQAKLPDACHDMYAYMALH